MRSVTALGIPFPLRMDNLAKAARARGFDPDRLWPWWKKMREDREAAKRERPLPSVVIREVNEPRKA